MQFQIYQYMKAELRYCLNDRLQSAQYRSVLPFAGPRSFTEIGVMILIMMITPGGDPSEIQTVNELLHSVRFQAVKRAS